MPTLLVIDDEPAIRHAFQRAFGDPNILVAVAASAAEGLDSLKSVRPDVIVLDLHLPDAAGLDTFRRIHELDAKIPVIVITGHGTTDTAIEAIKMGAFEYLLKPLELPQLRELVNKAFEISRLMRVPAVCDGGEPPPSAGAADVLVGRSAGMQEVYKAIGRVAPQDVTVLVLGDSGTGKELVARAIYHHSRRSSGPFLAINFAAIPENLLESELFGHEKGAFTGADRRRIGKFEQCSGGTLFLDEIGDMTPLTQSKILRVLQEQKFERIGGNETIKTDVRVIAATHRDLEKLASTGRFRADLYYRLSVFTIKIPPLRDRADDLPLLAEYFVRRFNRELGKDVRSVAPETLDVLRRYGWPGNMRELQSVLKQALLSAQGPVLLPDFLPAAVRAEPDAGAAAPAAEALDRLTRYIEDRLRAGSTDLLAEWRNLTERHLLTRVLSHAGGNLSQTAKILGINRATLRTRMAALGMREADAPQSEE